MSSPFESIKDGMISVLTNNATLAAYVSTGWSRHIFRYIASVDQMNEGRLPIIGIETGDTAFKMRKGTNIYVDTGFTVRAAYLDTTSKDWGGFEDAINTFAWDIVKALATSEDFSYSFILGHHISSIKINIDNAKILFADILYNVEWYYDQDSIS